MEWGTVIGVIIGGIATLAGGWLQAVRTEKSARRQRMLDEKVAILKSLMSTRVALQNSASGQIFGPNFTGVVNSIDIAFRDNEEVLSKYAEFKSHVMSTHRNADRVMELLYQLAMEMYKDVGMRPPTVDEFTSVVSLTSVVAMETPRR